MKVVVVGAGAVGAYYGAKLAKAGHEVTFVARGAHAEALRERGLTVQLDSGEEHFDTPNVVPLEQARGLNAELVLIAVKWPSLREVCAVLPDIVAADGLVAPLINGVESEAVVAEAVGAERTVAALAYISSGLTGPGALYVHGPVRVAFASTVPGQFERVKGIAQAFADTGIGVNPREDATQMLWEKMVWNAAFNGLCALTDQTAGYVADHAEPLVQRAMLEIIAVANAEGASLMPGMVDVLLGVTRTQFKDTVPSMLQDVRAGRATEVDILQGAVARAGAKHGIDTPVMETMASLLRLRTTS